MWFYFILGGFFIAIGLAIHVFKWYFLIAGYNTMSKEKKANVDIKGLGRLMAIYSYVNGSIFIAIGVLHALGLKPGIPPAMVFLIVSTIYLLVRAQKFDGNIYDENGKLRKGAGKQLILPIGITVVTVVFVTALMFFSSQAAKVTLLEEGIRVHGIYGDVYVWESIGDVKLIEDLPAIEMRTNGSAFGGNLKGHFRTTEYGPVKLFVNVQKPPFIYLQTEEGITIFNMPEADATKATFQEILKQRE